MTLNSHYIQILNMQFSGCVSSQEFEDWLSQIQIFLDQGRTFVLVMQTSPNTEFPEDYREIQSRWYKKYKTLFFQYCLGLARIAQDEEDRIRLDTPALQQAWKVPYFVSLSQTDALNWAVQRSLCKTQIT
ncbi:hypothetical protein [Acinetobacter ursingii]|uniref:hypothetical protein n=1 Tax=Acinetobacter ursingii TaxID=108980 RepID=UPI0021D3C44A|nr:hypothetical protein [Acinetobacter ursingii]MCU4357534.1 hypothetical protein [Acinetobacter ursingii]